MGTELGSRQWARGRAVAATERRDRLGSSRSGFDGSLSPLSLDLGSSALTSRRSSIGGPMAVTSGKMEFGLIAHPAVSR
jgi:hypothetical protein